MVGFNDVDQKILSLSALSLAVHFTSSPFHQSFPVYCPSLSINSWFNNLSLDLHSDDGTHLVRRLSGKKKRRTGENIFTATCFTSIYYS